MQQAFQGATAPVYKADKPLRNDLYRRFIKRFPCLEFGATRNIDPCHTGGHGLLQKASDPKFIPLYRKLHDELDKAPADFAIVHWRDIPALIHFFTHHWELKRRAA